MKTHHESDVERLVKAALARETMEQKSAARPEVERETAQTATGSRSGAANITAPTVKTILVPTDFSPRAEGALAYARCFAEQFGAQVILLHVVESVTYAPAHCPIEDVAELRTTRRTLAEEALGRVIAQFFAPENARPVRCHGMVEEGGAAIVTDRVARECAADLIVITTHGYTGLNRLLLGSTAESIVRHAPCPVLVVPARGHPSGQSPGKH